MYPFTKNKLMDILAQGLAGFRHIFPILIPNTDTLTHIDSPLKLQHKLKGPRVQQPLDSFMLS